MNRLYFGDNLAWLRNRNEFPKASVDLVYLDPPFNSNADYNVLFRETHSVKKSSLKRKVSQPILAERSNLQKTTSSNSSIGCSHCFDAQIHRSNREVAGFGSRFRIHY